MSSLLYETRMFAWQARIQQRCFIIGPIFCFFKDHFVIQVLWIVMGTKNMHNLLDDSCAFFWVGYSIKKKINVH